MASATTATSLDYERATTALQAAWASGDFHEISRQIVGISEKLCEAADPHAGERVLDIACGSGNTALAAARRHCEVSGIDYVPALIARAEQRAHAEGVRVDFRVADAQELPFPDASFDCVMSVFGVMFAPDQQRAAGEMLRVTRPGGVIALASWIPEGFGIDFFGAHSKHNPPPPGLDSPMRWGTEKGLSELMGDGVRAVRHKRRSNRAYSRSIDHAVDQFCAYFGPTNRALQLIGPTGEAALRRDVAEALQRHNVAEDGTAIIEGEYLQTIAIRN